MNSKKVEDKNKTAGPSRSENLGGLHSNKVALKPESGLTYRARSTYLMVIRLSTQVQKRLNTAIFPSFYFILLMVGTDW